MGSKEMAFQNQIHIQQVQWNTNTMMSKLDYWVH